MRRGTTAILWMVAAIVALAPAAATAQHVRVYEVEFAAGATFPGPEALDDGVTAAVRFGRTTGSSTALDLTVGYLGSDILAGDGSSARLDSDTFVLELNETLSFNNRGRVRPAVSLGIGWAWTDVDAADLEVGDGLDDNSFTANGALKLELWVSQRLAIIPAVEVRWFEARAEDSYDPAATLAVAYRFHN